MFFRFFLLTNHFLLGKNNVFLFSAASNSFTLNVVTPFSPRLNKNTFVIFKIEKTLPKHYERISTNPIDISLSQRIVKHSKSSVCNFLLNFVLPPRRSSQQFWSVRDKRRIGFFRWWNVWRNARTSFCTKNIIVFYVAQVGHRIGLPGQTASCGFGTDKEKGGGG